MQVKHIRDVLIPVIAVMVAAGCDTKSLAGPDVIDPCAGLPAIKLGQAVTGTIDAESCVVAETRRGVHTFVLEAETDLKLEGTMPAGEGWCLCVYTEDGRFLSGGGGGAAYYRLAPGRYQVVVNSKSMASLGEYTFSTSSAKIPEGCFSLGTTVTAGVVIAGTVTSGDCFWSPATSGARDGRRFDTYSRYLEAGDRVDLTLTGDPAMQLEVRPFCCSTVPPVTSAVGKNVQLQFTAPEKNYFEFMVVTQGGSYTLQVD